MPEIPLTFKITLVDGRKIEQTATCDANGQGPQSPQIITTQALVQYATVGMLKGDGKKFHLITASQIAEVEVEIPSIVMADMGDLPRQNNRISL